MTQHVKVGDRKEFLWNKRQPTNRLVGTVIGIDDTVPGKGPVLLVDYGTNRPARVFRRQCKVSDVSEGIEDCWEVVKVGVKP